MQKLKRLVMSCLAVLAMPVLAFSPINYARSIELTASGYRGESELSDFPALVRLSPERVANFNYADFKLPNGGDLRFTDAEGNLLASEVDTWNESGESLVWVKLPSLKAGTKIVAYYGNATPDEMVSTSLWSDYLGVWHFNAIDGGVTKDSTANGLDMTAVDANESTVDSNGSFGAALVNSSKATSAQGGFTTAAYNGQFSSDTFTVSAWFNRRGNPMNGYERFFSSKSNYADGNGFEMENKNSNATRCTARGSDGSGFDVAMPDLTKDEWVKVTLVYQGTTLSVYTNGALSASGKIAAVKPNANGLAVGNNAQKSERALRGCVDEVRFVKSALSAERVAAEWASERAEGIFTNSGAVQTDASAIAFDGAPTVALVDGAFVVSAKLAANGGTVSAVYGPTLPFATTNLIAANATAPNAYTLTLDNLAENVCYSFGVIGENAKGTKTEVAGLDCFLNGSVTLEKGADAAEVDLTKPGTVVVSRPSAGMTGNLVVNYTVSGTAVAGVNYEALTGSVTIPDGQASATIEIRPLRAKDGDHTVTITLADGLYFVDGAAQAATITIKTLSTPEGYNTWVAREDGNASDAANWSDGLPKTTDKIYVSGLFSSANMVWDGGVNGLPSEVAAWKQTDDYAGTVTFETGYSGDFARLTIAGDVEVASGAWTHPANGAAQVSRLDVAVGGNFTLGGAAKVDVQGKGFSAGNYPTGSGIAAHACSPAGDLSAVYGDVYAPVDLGAGGKSRDGDASCGGGAVRLVVSGAAIIDGTVDARSSSSVKKRGGGVGAGGSVFITARSIAGAGTVTVSAYTADVEETSKAEGASGGRIALVATQGEVAIPLANLAANGGPGSKVSGGGTIFVKNAADANGTLLVGTTKGAQWSYVQRYPTPTATTVVPPGKTWTFDRVLVRDQGILGVPEGATLILPNGVASVGNVKASDTELQCGLLYMGGEIRLPETTEHLMKDAWLFEALVPYTFAGNLRLTGGAGIGNLTLLQPTIEESCLNQVVVTGDMTVEKTGKVYARMRGQKHITGGTMVAAHGGSADAAVATDVPYDSIFHPRYSGMSGQAKGDSGAQNVGGGAVRLTVLGTLELNGTIDCASQFVEWYAHGGSGGSVDLTVGRLSGSGKINASGSGAGSGSKAAGAGGRVAIKLTDADAVFSDYWKSAILVAGGIGNAGQVGTGYDASAGTIYLQEGAEEDGAGTIVVRNTGSTDIQVPTVLPSQADGNETAKELKNAALSVEKAAIVRLGEDLSLRAATIAAGSNGKIDLNGKSLTLRVLSLGGEKIPAGVYKVGDAALGDYVMDSSEGAQGTVVISSGGFRIIIR